MPLTFPSHLAPVLPLKRWRPDWFDGVALAAGAVAPDVAYLFSGTRFHLGMRTHTLDGLLWWCLPVGLAYTWVIRRVIAGVVVHLPAPRLFGWSQYVGLAGVRHPWQVTVCSVLIGAFSHVASDRLCHSERVPRLFGIADFHALTGLHWWQFADVIASLGGGLLVLALAVYAARRGEIFDGEPPAVPAANPLVFWRVALAVTGLGALLLPGLPAATAAAPAGVRVLHLGALALVAGAAAARAARPVPADRGRHLEDEQRRPG
ncbi:DUF4184 family protein [Micromonospora sp. NBS 11-29]|uniref:DUF4184 family protein n=1 Tax=Micromonospora sp. NBS 11-29 TaxID=1960879 RepID=UPI000B76D31F|nr:DUF4184 family protein [Micromonospora sp. NBS 11-29]